MSDPYITAEDRVDVIGRLAARLNNAGAETLREKAAAHAEAMSIPDPLTPLKPVKDEGEKDHKDGDEKDLPKDDPKDGIFEGPDDLSTSPKPERLHPARPMM